jgi:hypothetical protein
VVGARYVSGQLDDDAPVSAAAGTHDRGVATIDGDLDAESDLVSHDEPPPSLPSAGALDGHGLTPAVGPVAGAVRYAPVAAAIGGVVEIERLAREHRPAAEVTGAAEGVRLQLLG